MQDLLTTDEACDLLGVRPQSLYAYVSRGLVEPVKDGRRSLYPRVQLESLAQRTARGRRPGRLELHIETAVTKLDPAGRLLYREVDVAELASSWSFERTARWLWEGIDRGEPTEPWQPHPSMLAVARKVQRALPEDTAPADRLRVAVSTIASAIGDDHRTLLTTAVEAMPALRSGAPHGASIASRLWPRLTVAAPTPRRIVALDTAMSVLADHELATPTLAARVAVSTGASSGHAILAALAAMAGPWGGGAHEAARRLLRESRRDGPAAAIELALERVGYVPGAGHAVYRRTDPRLRPMLDAVRRSDPSAPVLRAVADLQKAITRRRLGPATVDLGLAALAEAHDMAPRAGDVILGVARMAGWIAHIDEELRHPQRFRPRAVYVGHRG